MNLFTSKGFPYHRGRRLRTSGYIRDLVSESYLTTDDLVMPYFIREEKDNPLINKMIGLKRLSIIELLKEIDEITKNGIKAIALFPKIDQKKKI